MSYEELKALLQYVETLENKEKLRFDLSVYKVTTYQD